MPSKRLSWPVKSSGPRWDDPTEIASAESVAPARDWLRKQFAAAGVGPPSQPVAPEPEKAQETRENTPENPPTVTEPAA